MNIICNFNLIKPCKGGGKTLNITAQRGDDNNLFINIIKKFCSNDNMSCRQVQEKFAWGHNKNCWVKFPCNFSIIS